MLFPDSGNRFRRVSLLAAQESLPPRGAVCGNRARGAVRTGPPLRATGFLLSLGSPCPESPLFAFPVC